MKMKKYKIQKRIKPFNPIAKDLRTPKYQERVVHPKRYVQPPKVTLRNYEDD